MNIKTKSKIMKNSKKFLDYTKLAVVGKGAFGTAVLYRRETDNKEIVVKEVNMTDMPLDERRSALNEVKVLSSLNHPHIIKYFGSFEQDGSLFIEMEYADGGTLAQYLDVRRQKKKKLKEKDILFLFQQISSAIDHMHKHKILHRDLKTANIFLTKDFTVKVGDFGISKMMSTLIQAQTLVGTPYYLSPEMCENRDYDEKTDIWALGCILYEMIELKKPFEATNLPALITKITTCDFEPISRKYSNELQQLINLILQKNSNQRPSAQTICKIIIPQIVQGLESERILHMTNKRTISERSVLYELKGFKNDFSLEPIQLPICKLMHVAVGRNHCLALTDDCLVYAWGDNRCGQLGLGELAPWRNYPIRINSLTGKNIKQVAAGNGFSIFLNNIGLLMSCGDGRQGCLGHGDLNSITHPRIINKMITVNIIEIKCGSDHVMALSVNGDLYAWGCGRNGRLGLGDEDYRSSPTLIQLPSTSYKVKQFYCGGDGSIIITTNGQLFATGSNANNKLGLSTKFQTIEISLNFKLIKSIKTKIKDLYMGEHHTILITEDGTLLTMGRNNEGQLGKGHCKVKVQPGSVHNFTRKIMTASCGSTYSVVGSVDNVIYFWGTRYDTPNNKQIFKPTESSSTVLSVKPFKFSALNPVEDSFNTTTTSFCSDIVKQPDMELIKIPRAILGLFASAEHIAAGELVWLIQVFSFDNNTILVWVNTTLPPPITDDSDDDFEQNKMVSKWTSFESLKRDLTSLPNTPHPD